MTTSRAESQQSHFSRRRSNTTQSILRQVPPTITPLKVGESKPFNLWVHDIKDSPSILFNHSWWPGVAEGDLLRVMSVNSAAESSFLFVVPKEDVSAKPQLQVNICRSRVLYLVHFDSMQISVPEPMANAFGLRNHGEINVMKVGMVRFYHVVCQLCFRWIRPVAQLTTWSSSSRTNTWDVTRCGVFHSTWLANAYTRIKRSPSSIP